MTTQAKIYDEKADAYQAQVTDFGWKAAAAYEMGDFAEAGKYIAMQDAAAVNMNYFIGLYREALAA